MITKDEIRKIFLDNGFTIKDGNDDLADYVYDAAFALAEAVFEETHSKLLRGC